jgi:hypothetical protein
MPSRASHATADAPSRTYHAVAVHGVDGRGGRRTPHAGTHGAAPRTRLPDPRRWQLRPDEPRHRGTAGPPARARVPATAARDGGFPTHRTVHQRTRAAHRPPVPRTGHRPPDRTALPDAGGRSRSSRGPHLGSVVPLPGATQTAWLRAGSYRRTGGTSTASSCICAAPPKACLRGQDGLMFALRCRTFPGSYSALIPASRAYFSPPADAVCKWSKRWPTVGAGPLATTAKPSGQR